MTLSKQSFCGGHAPAPYLHLSEQHAMGYAFKVVTFNVPLHTGGKKVAQMR